MFGHMTDVGGKVPGSLPTDAKMIFEEGIQIPPVKIYRRGELNKEVLDIMPAQHAHAGMEPVGLQRHRRGAAAGRTARARECRRFGDDTYISAMQDMLDRNYRP
jgi:N-methylhydantoinase B